METADDPRDVVDTGWQKNGLELEIFFSVRSSSEAKFDERVCLELTEKVRQRTGVATAIVYNASWPHPAARAAIEAASNRKFPAPAE